MLILISEWTRRVGKSAFKISDVLSAVRHLAASSNAFEIESSNLALQALERAGLEPAP